MIVIGICCWISELSQLPELKRCLDSVKEFRVILIDGKWKDMPGDNLMSIPEAFTLMEKYPNVEVVIAANGQEWENRNMYLERCKEDDVLIVLDTDEWLEIVDANYKDVIEGINGHSFSVSFEGKGHGSGVYGSRRGIRWPNHCRYNGKHNEIIGPSGNKMAFKTRTYALLIHHDKTYRSNKVKEAMKIRNKNPH